MKTVLCICFFLLPLFTAVAQQKPRQTSDTERGKYIVERVAMCIQCHTPRTDKGDLIMERYLRGAPMPVKAPAYPDVAWALKTPAIAGLPGYTDQEAIRLLMEGITRDGRTPTPPMPPFRMNRADAEAVVAFLKSLP